jgi:DNA end-binding protein Ku
MNQLHKDCNQRVRNQLVCPTHGPISRDDLVKGYEYEKDTYVIIEKDDLNAIRLESTKTVDLIQFIDADEIDPLYINSPYYLGPDGPVAEEAFGVIRAAMKKLKKIGIGKLVLQGREQVVALSVSGKGFLMTTLRYATEVRQGDQFFGDLKERKAEEEQIQLAESIIKSKAGKFDPSKFRDQYKEAFFEVVKAKIDGEEPVVIEEEETPKTFNFMDALKQSVAKVEKTSGAPRKKKKTAAKASGKKPPAKSVAGTRKKRVRKPA